MIALCYDAALPQWEKPHGTLDRLATEQDDYCHPSRYLGNRDVGERSP